MNKLLLDERVLVLAPTAADAALSKLLLAEAGLACNVCADLCGLCRAYEEGAGAILLTEEVFGASDSHSLVDLLHQQPVWSDVPILLLTSQGADSLLAVEAMERLGNVTLLERPVRLNTLVSALRTALRARRRQYELRKRLEERRASEQRLRQSEQRLAEELEAITRLHALNSRLLAADDLNTALDDVLENAIAACGAAFGYIQLYNPDRKALEIVAQRGFRQGFLDYFRQVRVGDGSACAKAMQSGERIIIEDVELDPEFAPHRHMAASAGFRAVQSTPLRGREGTVLGMMSTHFRQPQRLSERSERLLDLYARHAADVILRFRYEQALKDADRRKDEFLAMLAHELRNPLAPIRTGLDRMRLKVSPDSPLQPVLDMVERQLGQMSRLVDDLLDVSRITRGKITLRKERVDLHAIITQAVETARPLIDARLHDLTYTPAPEPLLLEADPTRLAQALSNVLSNAAKYTEQGGRIWLTAKWDNGEAIVRVQDNGIGIEQAMLPSVFDLFTQAHHAQGQSSGGLGIGLAVAKQLVEMHGGSVTAHSAGRGQGSEFVFRLPLLKESGGAETAVRGGIEAPGRTAGRRRILLVDDLADVAEGMAALVREAFGHEVRTAHDGPTALRVAADFRPELMLLDIGLPGMSGYEVARRLRELPGLGDAVLVALTGWGQEEDRRKTQEAGFNHHLVKPVGLQELQQLLTDLK